MILHNVGKVYIPEHGHHISALTHAGDVNIKQERSALIHKHNLLILSRLSDFVKCR